MSRTPARLTLAALLPALALAVVPLSPASAGPRPETISLATGSSPEGITAGPGGTFYAGARAGGAVYQGDVRTGELTQLVASREGEVAVGLSYDAATGRVWVAGGATGDVTAYDARTGAALFTANAGEGRFLNDVAVTRDAVHVTDSRRNEVVVVPLGAGSALPAAGTLRVLTVAGDYVQPTGFGLNGIVPLPGGDLLAVSGGALYRIDPATGVADRLEIAGTALTGGDGLVLRGSTLYVVRGYGRNSIVVVKLDRAVSRGEVLGELTDPDFDVPTTAAFVAGDLYAVNGQFSTPDPALPTEVVRVDGTWAGRVRPLTRSDPCRAVAEG